MTLECWMERQVASGREPTELFEKAIRGTDCAAILGLCVSIFLAHPQKCLHAGLPFMMSSRCWLWDFDRSVQDLVSPYITRNPHFRPLIEEVDKQFRRKSSVRDTVVLYTTSSESQLREPVISRLSRFADEVPYSFTEERDDSTLEKSLLDRLEMFKAMGDPANYQFFPSIDSHPSSVISIVMPSHIESRLSQEQENGRFIAHSLRVQTWVLTSFEANSIQESLSISEALNWIHTVKQSSDGYVLKPSSDSAALVGACAALVSFAFLSIQEAGLLKFCEDLFLQASEVSDDALEWGRLLAFDISAMAARGLGALISRQECENVVRQKHLQILRSKKGESALAAFASIRECYKTDATYFWIGLGVYLSSCIDDSGDDAVSELSAPPFDLYLNTLQEPRVLELPTIEATVDLDSERLGSLLVTMVIPDLTDSLSRLQLTRLARQLFNWTVQVNKPREGYAFSLAEECSDWNASFFNWLTRLSEQLSFQENMELFLVELCDEWVLMPQLMSAALESQIWFRLSSANPLNDSTILSWQHLSKRVLQDFASMISAGETRMPPEWSEILSLLVFVKDSYCILAKTWAHVVLFKDDIDDLVSLSVGFAGQYHSLLIFLDGPGWMFGVDVVLDWIHRSASPISDSHKFFSHKGNGDITAQLLLRIWEHRKEHVLQNVEELRKYSYLVDELVKSGVPLARVLQEELEKSGR